MAIRIVGDLYLDPPAHKLGMDHNALGQDVLNGRHVLREGRRGEQQTEAGNQQHPHSGISRVTRAEPCSERPLAPAVNFKQDRCGRRLTLPFLKTRA